MIPRMRQLLCVALVLAVLAPAAAMAKPGNGNGKGQDKAPAAAADKHETKIKPEKGSKRAEQDSMEDAGEPLLDGKAAKRAEKEQRKAEKRLHKQAWKSAGGAAASLDASPTPESEETSPTVKKTGIANALSHVQANLERAAARGKIPPGLARVVAKFMSWLGLTPDDAAPVDQPGSDETSPTVPPSGETSPTLPPSDETSPAVPPSDTASDGIVPDGEIW